MDIILQGFIIVIHWNTPNLQMVAMLIIMLELQNVSLEWYVLIHWQYFTDFPIFMAYTSTVLVAAVIWKKKTVSFDFQEFII